jgi:multidrug efflux pump subunit AcrB
MFTRLGVASGNVRPHGWLPGCTTPLYRRRALVELRHGSARWWRAPWRAALACRVIGPVEQQFFPTSARGHVDMFPQGSSPRRPMGRATQAAAAPAEVRSLSAYVGAGAPRFFLALNPEMPDAAFAKVIAITGSADERNALIAEIDAHGQRGEWGAARVRATGLLYGPPLVWPVVFRVLGPDVNELRAQAERVRAVLARNPNVVDAHLDWGERAPLLRLDLDPDRLRQIGLTPQLLAQQLQLEFDGAPATQLREDVRSVQLVVRGARNQRASLGDVPLKTLDGRSITLAQAGRCAWRWKTRAQALRRQPVIAVNASVRGAQPRT